MKTIKRNCLITLISIFCLMLFSSIYAVGIDIYETGEVNSKFNSNIKVNFRLAVKLYGGIEYTGDLKNWYLYPDASTNYYRTYGVLFSKKPGTIYNGDATGAGLINKSVLNSGSIYADDGSGSDTTYWKFNASGNNLGSEYKLYRIEGAKYNKNNPNVVNDGVSTSGLQIFTEISDNSQQHIRDVGISDTIINELKNSGYFTESFTKTVNGQKYYGVFVSVIASFYSGGSYRNPLTAIEASSYTVANGMAWAGNSDGKTSTGTIVPGKNIYNLYDNILWIKDDKVDNRKVTVNVYFTENGNTTTPIETYTRTNISVSDIPDDVRNLKPEQSQLTILKNDANFNKFNYTKYKINNGTENTSASIDKAALNNGDIIHVYFDRIVKKVTVKIHFTENGKDIGEYTQNNLNVEDMQDNLNNFKPDKSLTTLKDDANYDKFIYTKHKINDNGTENTSTTLDKSKLSNGNTIHIYFERTNIKVKYTENSEIKHEENLILSGSTPTISRNENNDAGLSNEYYDNYTQEGGSGTSTTENNDIKVKITNNNTGGTQIIIEFKYYKVNVKVNILYVHSNDVIETQAITLDRNTIAMNGSVVVKNLQGMLEHKDKFLNSNIKFGYFGGEVTNGKINITTGTKWNWSTPTQTPFDITITPDKSKLGGEITVNLYYTARILDVQIVNAYGSIVKRKINTYSTFTNTLSASILANKDTSIPFIIDGTKYLYNGLRSATATSYITANSALNNTTWKVTEKQVSFDKMNENIYMQGLQSGGDYNIAQFRFTAIQPSKVYVRHLVETKDSNNYTIKRTINNKVKYYVLENKLINTNQSVKHNLSYYEIDQNLNISEIKSKTGYELIIPGTISGYSEVYEIDSEDILTVEKSRTIYNEGMNYRYLGYSKYTSSTDSQNATINLLKDTETNLTKNNTQCDITGKNKVTYVDFFYEQIDKTPDSPGDGPGGDEPSDDPDPDSPTEDPIVPNLYVDPEPEEDNETISATGIDENLECKVTYVPITEYVRPYLITKTSAPYTLIYEVTGVSDSGIKTYVVKQYDAYCLTGGYVTNPSNIGDTEARFISTDNDGVINANGRFNLTVANISTPASTVSAFAGTDPRNQSAIDDVVESIPLTAKSNFMNNNNKQQVLETKFNGVRIPKGVAVYNIVGLVGANTNSIIRSNVDIAASEKNTTKVNVYTPLKLSKPDVKTDTYVDHSTGGLNGVVIPKNSKFTITPKLDTGYTGSVYNSKINMSQYLGNYWVVLDFDVAELKVYNSNGTLVSNPATLVNGVLKANTKVYVPAGGKLEAREASAEGSTSTTNNIKVLAATKNATMYLKNTVVVTNEELTASSTLTSTGLLSLIAKEQISSDSTSCDDDDKNTNHIVKVDIDKDGKEEETNILDDGIAPKEKEMESDSLYFAQTTTKTVYIDRIYDFKVTDCLDVNFKNVFRKTSEGNVNESTGIYYFSGIKRLIVSPKGETQGTNLLEDRSALVLNKVSTKTILPLGPIKHTDTSYMQAPKLGYRFSFDLKTSGTYTPGNGTTRSIVIVPSYYYIKKDGTGFNDNITLYYKNSSGKYVSFVGSNYDIYFKPNDGYRVMSDTYINSVMNVSKLSDKLEKLTIGSKNGFILTENMMGYYQDPSYIQTWYGEFKLPNSTIAVSNDSGDINNPLTGGYIGVKFEIKCIDKLKDGTTITISYNENNKDSEGNKIPNSTQWDYEGYIGMKNSVNFSSVGELRLQLENGVWRINSQSKYDSMKGTVILYDTDNRAANDFE